MILTTFSAWERERERRKEEERERGREGGRGYTLQNHGVDYPQTQYTHTHTQEALKKWYQLSHKVNVVNGILQMKRVGFLKG